MPFEDYKSKLKVDTVKTEIFADDLISLLLFLFWQICQQTLIHGYFLFKYLKITS